MQLQIHSPVAIGAPVAPAWELAGDIVEGAPVASVGASVIVGTSVADGVSVVVSLHRHSLLLLHGYVLLAAFILSVYAKKT